MESLAYQGQVIAADMISLTAKSRLAREVI